MTLKRRQSSTENGDLILDAKTFESIEIVPALLHTVEG